MLDLSRHLRRLIVERMKRVDKVQLLAALRDGDEGLSELIDVPLGVLRLAWRGA